MSQRLNWNLNRTKPGTSTDKMTRPYPIQLELFDQPTLNVARDIKIAMNEDMKASGKSREQIVDLMNDLAFRYGVSLVHGNSPKLTLEAFEKWLNVSDLSRQIPLKALPVFQAATGHHETLNVLARAIGLRVVGPREQKMLDWAEAKMAIKKHANRIKKLEAEI